MRIHVLVPEGFDDPGLPSGGNVYDRQVCARLAEAGWDVRVTPVAAAWPAPGPAAQHALARLLSAVPDGDTVLIDGLIASPAAAPLLPQAGRLRLTVLLHMPLATAFAGPHPGPHPGPDPQSLASERAVLHAAAGVIVPSHWTRQQVLARFALPPDRVHVAQPGVDQPGASQPGAPTQPVPGRLICVGVLAPHKGQDLLIEALAGLAGLDWHCVLAGPLDRDPGFVRHLHHLIARLGDPSRVQLPGVLTGTALTGLYATAGLLVAPSRSETYGMTVTEALAHGVPVLAADVGGLPEALGVTPGGQPPGLLVPPDDPAALAAALRAWLTDEPFRRALHAAAAQRRPGLRGWDQTARDIVRALGLEKPRPGAHAWGHPRH